MNSNASSPTTPRKWDTHAYPYAVDYCDHFETPLRAYQDIAPIVDELFFKSNTSNSGVNRHYGDIHKKKRRRTYTDRSEIRVYDPYYCNGQTAVLLQDKLGYTAVHEKRDFYEDIERGTVPSHDILVTNPPYSDQHKKQCLDFCLKQLRTYRRPFCILMPNYVAARQYFRTALSGRNDDPHNKADDNDVVYLVPQTRYVYNHPQGTGKTESPFASLWFLGIGAENVQRMQTFWKQKQQQQQKCNDDGLCNAELVTTLEDLTQHPEFALCFEKRPNPRQRHKKKGNKTQNDSSSAAKAAKANDSIGKKHAGLTVKLSPTKKKRKSKYRNADGKREKRRF